MKNTVTISVEEYDELRKIKKQFIKEVKNSYVQVSCSNIYIGGYKDIIKTISKYRESNKSHNNKLSISETENYRLKINNKNSLIKIAVLELKIKEHNSRFLSRKIKP